MTAAQPTRYVIEGEPFTSARAVYEAAKARGYKGAESSFASRLRNTANNWASLCQPRRRPGQYLKVRS